MVINILQDTCESYLNTKQNQTQSMYIYVHIYFRHESRFIYDESRESQLDPKLCAANYF